MTRIQILEKQNKDLRVRNENLQVKMELCERAAPIGMLQKHIAGLETEIRDLNIEKDTLKKENAILAATVEKLKMYVQKLLGRIKKDSSSSNKPSSTDIFRKPKPQSLREKSGKKPGGQPGHPGHGLKLFDNPDVVIDRKIHTCGKCGCEVENSPDYEARQRVDIEIRTVVVEERVYEGICAHCGKKVRGSFSEGFVNPVQYGENLKAAVAVISEHGCVSVGKTAELINGFSGGKLNLSWGTIINIQRELSNRLDETINMIRAGLIAGSLLSADETGCRVSGSLRWIQLFCNDRFALFGMNEKRGDIDDNFGILTFFLGILVHDHFSSYYKFENVSHAECNEHILRYLKNLIEIFKHGWLTEMSKLLKDACHAKNELVTAGMKEMPLDMITGFRGMYEHILTEGRKEYEAATSGNRRKEAYYADERRLLDRLAEYEEQHLLFLTDFRAPFTNNMAEQDIRKYKTKTRVMGCFRSAEGARIYARIVSLITTLKKQNLNVYAGIRDVFYGRIPISSACKQL